MRQAPAPTCKHDLRACVSPVSGNVEEVSFLKVEKAGRLRADGRGRRTVFVCGGLTKVGAPDVAEKKLYLSMPNNISHVFYPGVYPIGMAGVI